MVAMESFQCLCRRHRERYGPYFGLGWARRLPGLGAVDSIATAGCSTGAQAQAQAQGWCLTNTTVNPGRGGSCLISRVITHVWFQSSWIRAMLGTRTSCRHGQDSSIGSVCQIMYLCVCILYSHPSVVFKPRGPSIIHVYPNI
jgi:hypothetical protein